MKGRLKLCGALLVLLMSGCSTYAVNDIYSTPGLNTEVLQSVETDAVDLKVSLVPTLRFSSVGMFGVPVLPMYLDSKDENELRLNIVMYLHKDLDFSFAGNPCFKLDNKRTLCPKLAEVSARAYVWSHEMHGKDFTTRVLKDIGNFYGRDRPKLIIRSLKSEDRISRADIYQHYEAYQGEPKFERFELNIDYVYDCAGPCPENFQFNTDGLMAIQDLQIESNTLELRQKKAGKLDLSVPTN
ncbi:MAG: hypothetical protein AB1516_11965 [Pseudomonadota bacterium]